MKLTFTTSYAENWRYSVMITLSMRDSAGNQVGYRSVEDTPLPIGSAAIGAPEGWVRRREVSVEFDPCHSVRFYLYLLLITFDLKIFKILKNSLIFGYASFNLKNSCDLIMC